MLADLRVGLSFEGREVREKLAKALERIAIASPDRLRHHLPDLAANLGDDSEFVRYHLASALVVVGCVHPAALADVADALVVRLDDENPHVRGRALEACGVLVRSSAGDLPVEASRLAGFADDEPFVARRARFAAAALENEAESVGFDTVGSVAAVRESTEAVVATMREPDGECPHCGVALPEPGQPACPECGAPR